MSLAADLYFDPEVGTIGPGNKIAIDVKIDVEACINALEADLSFPNDYLQVVDFIVGDSVLALWVDQPDSEAIKEANENGVLHFSGGTPGGYCGRIPGDPGKSNTIARVIFSLPSLIVSEVERSKLNLSFLPSTRVLLNDGFGTEDELITKIASYTYSNTPIEIEDNWSEQIISDNIAPEPFVIELRRDKSMFNNQSYVIFNTIDKQSGMDHYEILEIGHEYQEGVARELKWWEKLLNKDVIKPEWKVVKSPYLLEDQSLESIIRVKAIDKAGNERFVEYIPPESKRPAETSAVNYFYLVIIIVFFLVLLFLLLIIIKIIFKKYDKEKNN
ncbi:hypothetical protein C0583_04825 [Candidatus Parcubacteria bacterium]|nr:MAG: hypothetical protein C0583_04825 [Candidatus Parcubacteria bacterium]